MIPQIWRNRHSWYRLQGAKCRRCSELFFPPRAVCSECRSTNLELYEFKGKGKIESFTVVRTPNDEIIATRPYVLALVRLDEGPIITTQIVDVDPNQIQIGQRVSSVFRRLSQQGDEGVIHYGFKFKLE